MGDHAPLGVGDHAPFGVGDHASLGVGDHAPLHILSSNMHLLLFSVRISISARGATVAAASIKEAHGNSNEVNLPFTAGFDDAGRYRSFNG